MWPFTAIRRWTEKIDWRFNSRQERVVAVAEYEIYPKTKLAVFFMEDRNLTRYCRLLRMHERVAEEDTEVIRDGVAWCQEGTPPARSRPIVAKRPSLFFTVKIRKAGHLKSGGRQRLSNCPRVIHGRRQSSSFITSVPNYQSQSRRGISRNTGAPLKRDESDDCQKTDKQA
jgi:hypothetical protein